MWFGCDVGKHFHRDLGVMDTELFDYEMFYDTGFKMNKAERLEYGPKPNDACHAISLVLT